MGLEPVWKDHQTVLVSDASRPLTEEGDRGILWRIPRYQGIQIDRLARCGKRWLLSSFVAGVMQGAYWGIGSAVLRATDAREATRRLARDVIAEIRTDLDAFSDAGRPC